MKEQFNVGDKAAIVQHQDYTVKRYVKFVTVISVNDRITTVIDDTGKKTKFNTRTLDEWGSRNNIMWSHSSHLKSVREGEKKDKEFKELNFVDKLRNELKEILDETRKLPEEFRQGTYREFLVDNSDVINFIDKREALLKSEMEKLEAVRSKVEEYRRENEDVQQEENQDEGNNS